MLLILHGNIGVFLFHSFAAKVRWNKRAGTKIMLAENVTTGSVHRLSSEILSYDSEGSYDVKIVHCAPHDTGHGAVKRYRAWSPA